jgi:hypothetical protein
MIGFGLTGVSLAAARVNLHCSVSIHQRKIVADRTRRAAIPAK